MPVESRQRAFKRQCPMLPKFEEKERPPAIAGYAELAVEESK